MTVLYSQNFDSISVGAKPADFTIIQGDATIFKTVASGAVSGANAFAIASGGAFNRFIITGSGVVTTGRMTFKFLYNGSHFPQPMARMDAAGNNGFIIHDYQAFGTNSSVAGSPVLGSGNPYQVGGTGYAFPASNGSSVNAAGDIMVGEIAVSGNYCEWRFWNQSKGELRPVSPSGRGKQTAQPSGYFGIFCGGFGGEAAIDDIVIEDTFSPNAAGPVVQVPYTDANIFQSPMMWADTGTSRMAVLPGSYVKTQVYGTRVGVTISALTNYDKGASTPYTWIKAIIDGIEYEMPVWYGQTAFTFTDTLVGATFHQVEIFLRANGNLGSDRWSSTPNQFLQIVSIDTDGTGALQAATLRPNRLLVLSDSIGEGTYLDSYAEPIGDDCTGTWVPALARVLNAEYSQICRAAISLTGTAGDGAPGVNGSYDQLWTGKSRLSNGLYTVQPDDIVVSLGTNGGDTQAQWATCIANQRAAAPNARIHLVTPLGGGDETIILAAVAAARSAGDLKVFGYDSVQIRREMPVNGGGGQGAVTLATLGRRTTSWDNTHWRRTASERFAAHMGGRMKDNAQPRRYNLVAA